MEKSKAVFVPQPPPNKEIIPDGKNGQLSVKQVKEILGDSIGIREIHGAQVVVIFDLSKQFVEPSNRNVRINADATAFLGVSNKVYGDAIMCRKEVAKDVIEYVGISNKQDKKEYIQRLLDEAERIKKEIKI